MYDEVLYQIKRRLNYQSGDGAGIVEASNIVGIPTHPINPAPTTLRNDPAPRQRIGPDRPGLCVIKGSFFGASEESNSVPTSFRYVGDHLLEAGWFAVLGQFGQICRGLLHRPQMGETPSCVGLSNLSTKKNCELRSVDVADAP